MIIWTGLIAIFQKDENNGIIYTSDFMITNSLVYSSADSVMDACELKARTSPNFKNSMGSIQVISTYLKEDGTQQKRNQEILEMSWNYIPGIEFLVYKEELKYQIIPQYRYRLLLEQGYFEECVNDDTN